MVKVDIDVETARMVSKAFAIAQDPPRQKTVEVDSGPWVVDECYLIRTVTFYWTGRVKEIHEHEIVLSDAAWIADTGRFSQAIASGSLNEIEPVKNDVIVGRNAVIDAVVWEHDLPRNVKGG